MMGKCIDLTGQKFGRLTVIERTENYKSESGENRAQWLCKCECGNDVVVIGKNLRRGMTNSCGCLRKDVSKTHGHSGERIYGIWATMKQRCSNPNAVNYSIYGAEGKVVCDEWQEFEPFYDWAMANGYREDLTIERKDGAKGYSPENCRWATMKEQQNNTRHNRYITHKGETHTMAEWSEITGISYHKLNNRINRLGWDGETAVGKLENPSCHYIEYKGKRQTIAELSREYNIAYDTLKQRINKLHWNIEKALTTPARGKCSV